MSCLSHSSFVPPPLSQRRWLRRLIFPSHSQHSTQGIACVEVGLYTSRYWTDHSSPDEGLRKSFVDFSYTSLIGEYWLVATTYSS